MHRFCTKKQIKYVFSYERVTFCIFFVRKGNNICIFWRKSMYFFIKKANIHVFFARKSNHFYHFCTKKLKIVTFSCFCSFSLKSAALACWELRGLPGSILRMTFLAVRKTAWVPGTILVHWRAMLKWSTAHAAIFKNTVRKRRQK